MNEDNLHEAPARGPADHGVRDQIFSAANEHFRLYGYEKTTVSDLAKSIGFSKAYIYKFFESKQAIGEAICASCLRGIEVEVREAVGAAKTPPDKIRQLLKVMTEANLKLFFNDRKLYEIAASAATERWQAASNHEERLRLLAMEIIQEGRLSGDFERKTPLDEVVAAVFIIMRPYLNPLMLQHSFDYVDEAPGRLAGLILRSLAP